MNEEVTGDEELLNDTTKSGSLLRGDGFIQYGTFQYGTYKRSNFHAEHSKLNGCQG